MKFNREDAFKAIQQQENKLDYTDIRAIMKGGHYDKLAEVDHQHRANNTGRFTELNRNFAEELSRRKY